MKTAVVVALAAKTNNEKLGTKFKLSHLRIYIHR